MSPRWQIRGSLAVLVMGTALLGMLSFPVRHEVWGVNGSIHDPKACVFTMDVRLFTLPVWGYYTLAGILGLLVCSSLLRILRLTRKPTSA